MDELVEESRIHRDRSRPPGRVEATAVWTPAEGLREEMRLKAIVAPARGKGHGHGRRSEWISLVVARWRGRGWSARI